MRNNGIGSDQLYNWSAHERFDPRATPAAPGLGPPIGPAPAPRASRLAHRALQAVWPPRLPMPTRRWTRAQVLPFSKPSRWPPRDGLRSGGIFPTGLRLLAELPESPPGARADLQSQPRVVTAKREVLSLHAHGAFILIPARSRLGGDACRQLVTELVASWFGPTLRHPQTRDPS